MSEIKAVLHLLNINSSTCTFPECGSFLTKDLQHIISVVPNSDPDSSNIEVSSARRSAISHLSGG